MAGTDGLRGKPNGVEGRQTRGRVCSPWRTGGDVVDVVDDGCVQVV